MKMFITMMSLNGMSFGIGGYTLVDAIVNSNLIGACLGVTIVTVSNINFMYWFRGEKSSLDI